MNDEKTRITHEYIISVSEKMINSTICDLGTKYDRIDKGITSATLYSDHYNNQPKEVPKSLFKFLISIGFIDATDHYLTKDGKTYFELMYIHQNTKLAYDFMKERLLENPVTNLIGQVFYGRGKISVEQLRILLNYHNIADWEIKHEEITSLLTLFNKFSILVYDKKGKNFYLKEPINRDEPLKQYYVTPSTPFSNIYNVRKIIKACRGDIYWVDKHFRKEGLEIVHDGLTFNGITSVTIVSGTENITQSAKSDFIALKAELNERGVKLCWQVITDKSFKWHDRWIVADNLCYNIPPILSIIRGQRANMLKTDKRLDVNTFLNVSIDLNSYRA
ncbi:MAG: hypothetical protein AB9844_05510 [Clostridiaceae bacterium]